MIGSTRQKRADLRLEVSIAPEVTRTFRKGDVRHCYADITRARETLGFEPKVSFEDGMRELIQWSLDAESEDRMDEAVDELKRRGLVG